MPDLSLLAVLAVLSLFLKHIYIGKIKVKNRYIFFPYIEKIF